MKKPVNKINSLIKVGIGLLIIVLMNIIGSFIFTRFDLTSEKRHTLSQATIDMVNKLEDKVYVRVYLEGDFPADFKRLRNAVKERLDELRAYAGDNIQYEFINPSESAEKSEREATWRKLVSSGLEPTEITIQGKDALERKIIFPGAIITYKGKDLPIQILRSQERIPSPEMLNSSINNLEYNLANSIRRLTAKTNPKIGILAGHGELSNLEIEDFSKALLDLYPIERVSIDSQLNALQFFQGLVIAKPMNTINEKDKFIIDQFIMRGGRVLWCIDGIVASMDSLKRRDETLGIAQNVNLDDMLFTYGARINKDLVIDRNCAAIALTVGQFGDQPNMQLFPWYFFPVLSPDGKHPISLNTDPIYTEFLSTIDTIGNPNIKKSILLSTSASTRIVRAPARINLGIVGINPDFGKNTVGQRPVAVLLEGKFSSVFANRIPPNVANDRRIKYKAEAIKPGKMIVIGDGDIIKNRVDTVKQIYFPLGFDKYQRRKIYGNKEFLLNAMNYLMDDEALISVRSREIKLRKLNNELVVNNKLNWQIINIALPIVAILILGIILFYLRKHKYAA